MLVGLHVEVAFEVLLRVHGAVFAVFPVLQVVMLAMYNLSLEGTGRQGYFRWKEDICAFIGRHWNFLLGSRSHRLSCFSFM